VQNLIDQTDEILLAFYEHPQSSKSTLAWVNDLVKSRYVESVRELAKKENGWHFGALQASAKKPQEFRIEDMAQKMEDLAPELWDLLGLMLSTDERQTGQDAHGPWEPPAVAHCLPMFSSSRPGEVEGERWSCDLCDVNRFITKQ
jgi:hypothetical protein